MTSGAPPVSAAWRRAMIPPLGAAISAVALAAASPPWDQGWLAWVALTPFFALILCSPSVGSRFRLGCVHGVVFMLALAPWFGAFTPVGYGLAALVWGVQEGLLAVATGRLTQSGSRRGAPALLAAAWVALEWLRAQGALRFPFGMLAATQHRNLPILQTLDLTGAYGLSFLVALASGVAAAALLRSPGSRAWAVGTAGLLVVLAGRGAWLLGPRAPEGPGVRVAVVQASQSFKVSGAAVQCVSPPAEYDRRTREALASDPELIVWPESARTDDVVHDPLTLERTTDLIRGTRAHLLTGSFIRNPSTGNDSNAAALLSPAGEVLGTYRKVWIVPFGEYMPARPLFFWAEAAGWPLPPSDLEPGTRWEPLRAPGVSVGVAICFESAFGRIARENVRRGAEVLAVLTSDGWVGRTAAGYQHAAFAPLRAVETRRWLMRAAATGVSTLIDPYGRPVGRLPMFDQGVLTGTVSPRQGWTPFVTLGDWPVAACWAFLLGGPVLRRLRGRRGTGAAGPGPDESGSPPCSADGPASG